MSCVVECPKWISLTAGTVVDFCDCEESLTKVSKESLSHGMLLCWKVSITAVGRALKLICVDLLLVLWFTIYGGIGMKSHMGVLLKLIKEQVIQRILWDVKGRVIFEGQFRCIAENRYLCCKWGIDTKILV
jgi:uncharacterized SAM-binding protein YcdF (DUF218 family)